MVQRLERVAAALGGAAVILAVGAACAAHQRSPQFAPPEPVEPPDSQQSAAELREDSETTPGETQRQRDHTQRHRDTPPHRVKKSAKKWQQLRAKRIADSQLRAATAAGYDPATADLRSLSLSLPPPPPPPPLLPPPPPPP
eukprot:COSAG03_NODE_697_length_6223_cov_9.359242_1_plen_140_part_10